MVREKRLIDANEYPCNRCEISYCYKNCDKFNAWFENTVDAVEVVRCKDCISGQVQPYSRFIRCNVMGCAGLKPDDFCSYGERKDK